MKKTILQSILILIAVVLIAAAGFLWLDFHIVRSTTGAEQSTNTYRSGNQLPESVGGQLTTACLPSRWHLK